MLLKVIETGRRWGDKREDSVTSVSVAGVKCTVTEYDSWSGPIEVGQSGQYFRVATVEPVAVRDDRWASKMERK